MWLLEPFISSSQIAANAGGSNLQTVYMIPNKSYIVGRKRDECEVFVDNDKSISRKHAVITVDDITIKQALIQSSDEPFVKPNLSVEDFSKYGTFVVKGSSPEKLVTSTKTDLAGGWRIRFGVYQSIYVIKHEMMIFCVSRLNEKDRKKLANQCKTVDAKYSTTWTDQCTHLVVDEKDCVITEKIGLALLKCIPIVTMQYVQELENCLTSNQRQTVLLPNIDNFYPSTVNSNWKEYGLSSPPDFKPNTNRKNLFSNMQFCTMNVSMCEKLMPIIETGGGTIENMSDSIIDDNFVRNFADAPCIIIENMIEPETLEKLKYYGFQLFTENAVMTSIILADTSNLKIVNLPSVPVIVEPVTTSMGKITVMSDEDRTDDELEVPENNDIPEVEKPQDRVEETFEPPLKKTKISEKETPAEVETPIVKDEPKKGFGIEIPLSLAEDDHEMEEPKKITPKKEIKLEKKEIVKREKVKVDPDEPVILVEYINLIKVKDETKSSQTLSYPQNGYNAKRFRKVKYDGSTISKSNISLVNSLALVEDSVNFDAELSTPTKSKEIKLVSKVETKSAEKKETKTAQKKETPKAEKKESTILDAIGLDDDEDDDDDEPTLLGVKRK